MDLCILFLKLTYKLYDHIIIDLSVQISIKTQFRQIGVSFKVLISFLIPQPPLNLRGRGDF